MDTKVLAKSKRAHTLHHNKSNKPHPNQKPNKTPSAANKQKPPKPSLPSNWDRYEDEEEEFDDSLESSSGDNFKKRNVKDNGVVLPKSKGADFKYLVREAKSKYHQVGNFPSLDDFFAEEFKHEVGPLLSVRGERILSWIGDDNFVVGDETATSHEASFLSLNLHALAEQLTKVDLSERLFIEADLLPPALGTNRSTSSSQVFDPILTTESKPSSSQEPDRKEETQTQSKATAAPSEKLFSNDFSKKNKAASHSAGALAPGSTAIGNSNPNFSVEGLVRDHLYPNQEDKSNQITASDSIGAFNASSVLPGSRLPTFEATAAENELDMLLDSCNDKKPPDSLGFTSVTQTILVKEGSEPQAQHTRNGPGSVKTTSAARMPDDVLDDLLEGTSNLPEKHAPSPLLRVIRNTVDSAKSTSTSVILDDILDDLLEETSHLSNQNDLHQPSELKAVPDEIQSSSSQSVSKSKALDDFDSWLDTI